MIRADSDAVHHTDIPVTCARPRPVSLRVHEVTLRHPLMSDPTVVAVILERRIPSAVIDFYRGRP